MFFVTFNQLPAPVVITEDDTNKQYLIRNALIFVEGDHTDSKVRDHSFPRERVIKIAENTNRVIERGGTIPILYDHQKTARSVVGSIDDPLILKEISKEDINQLVNGNKLNYLIGRLGIFSNSVKLKDPAAIEGFLNDIVRTISPGIDLRVDVIREVSIVATPAIPGLSLFSSLPHGEIKVLESKDENCKNGTEDTDPIADFYIMSPYARTYSLDEALKEKTKLDSKKQEFIETAELLWEVLLNIRTNFYDPNEIVSLSSENLQTFVAKVLSMLGLDEFISEQQGQSPIDQQMYAEGGDMAVSYTQDIPPEAQTQYNSVKIGDLAYFVGTNLLN